MSGGVWRPESLSAFEESSDVIYAIDGAMNLAYCNAAWDRFALSNGGAHLVRSSQIGRNVVEITPAVLRPFYAGMYARAMQTGFDAKYVYECSSAQTCRRFRMSVMRKDVPSGRAYLVILNSQVHEAPHRRLRIRADFEELREENGLITMCAHCRRTRIPNAGESWVWIEELVRRMPPEVSSGLCPVCFDIHYGG
jgi:hypothetical protein